jgi:hypothetical protein
MTLGYYSDGPFDILDMMCEVVLVFGIKLCRALHAQDDGTCVSLCSTCTTLVCYFYI